MLSLLTGWGAPESSLDWSTPAQPSPSPSHSPPPLVIDGRTLRTPAGSQVRLRGLNVCSFEFDVLGRNWQLSADGGSALLDVLANPQRWNANVVRLPVNQEWFLTDQAYVQRVERVIDAAALRNVYVILDVQWERAQRTEPYQLNILKEPTFGEGNTTEAFWLAAAGRLSNRSNVLFDLINEPHDVSFTRLHSLFQRLVNNIALRAPNALIVAGGPNWAHSIDDYRRRPLSGGRVIYSAHQYLPYDSPDRFAGNFEATAAEHPVIIGEFGPEGEVDGRGFSELLIDRAESAGAVGWLPWAIGCGLRADDDRGSGPGAVIAARLRELNRR